MRYSITWLFLVLLVGGLCGSPATAQSPPRCFEETGHCIDGRIRAYWEQNGGLSVFGYPITEQRAETIENTPIQVQWFERNRLELHPENEPPYDVLLGRLGVETLTRQGRDWQGFPRRNPRRNCRFFSETRQNVCGDILTAWQTSGLEFDGQPGISEAESLALFGLPISPLREEEIDKHTYRVQWFERARFELHPENEPPYTVLLGRLGSVVRSPTIDKPPSGRLAFVRSGDIYTINADGTNETQLTTHPDDDDIPVWSPDGHRIAFLSGRDGRTEVYLMQADGTEQTRITTSTRWAETPSWSPDSTRLAYTQDGEIIVHRIGDATTLQVTNRQEGDEWYNDPVWSPDGTQLAFWQAPIGDGGVFIADLSDGTITRLTDGIHPQWSPDGNVMLFEHSVSDEESLNEWQDLFRINVDGTELVNLTQNSEATDWMAEWSPDGTQIAFSQEWTGRLGYTYIVVMNTDGSAAQRVAPVTGEFLMAVNPTWSPDGNYIALVIYRETNVTELQGVYLVRADGSGEAFTLSTGGESWPAWQPQP
jgi:Tol biopolymer transport system component